VEDRALFVYGTCEVEDPDGFFGPESRLVLPANSDPDLSYPSRGLAPWSGVARALRALDGSVPAEADLPPPAFDVETVLSACS